MPLNIPGILAPFQLVVYPRLVIPHLKTSATLTSKLSRKLGYRGAVFDKDNCLTIPHKDQLVPELTDAWKECIETFGEANVLIVSNSAGTHLDAGGIQSESVSYNLGVPVLPHKALKPAYSCISSIRAYFSGLKQPLKEDELIVVGDRIFTDVIMANRMRKARIAEARSPGLLHMAMSCAYEKGGTVETEKESAGIVDDKPRPNGPLAVWTTGVWKREAMFMRYLELSLVNAVTKWSKPAVDEPLDTTGFVKEYSEPVPVKTSWVAKVMKQFKRT
ncbi:mitochondrial PGP phosphatase-domain-containing protein [Ephemerocybe angulata]|uniref:Mitochondrial PGP phosphatase-domain-containing protein n=1 Tax=Ephemerocybe angulata TaxID=980116 RepID=A0A8H6IEI7_9AGAR|nr:mitochondrial PGP phosphatase-domain-containing protein [Tulosesus angulatus]